MDELTVLVTGAGAPGFAGTYYSLVKNFDDRYVRIIGVDAKEDVYGKYLWPTSSLKFYQVPHASEDDFIDELSVICDDESVDVVLPQVEDELRKIAASKKLIEANGSTKVAISNARPILQSTDKYAVMDQAEWAKVPTPKQDLVCTWNELESAVRTLKLGSKFVIKPNFGSGMRGFRVVTTEWPTKKEFYGEKPSEPVIDMDILYEILGENFTQVVVQEYLPGDEYSVDVFSMPNQNGIDGVATVAIPRKRLLIRGGITHIGQVEKHEQLIEWSTNLSNQLGMAYAHGYQFKGDRNGELKLLECNARIQGSMIMSTLAGINMIYASVKTALGEPLPASMITGTNIRWGLKYYRTWGGIGVFNEKRYNV